MSIRQRLYPDESQAKVCNRHCSDARYVWNLGLEQRSLWTPGRTVKINYNSQAIELTEARKEFEWLRSGSSVVQQVALRDLDQAFKNWWKNPAHFGRPNWRKAGVNEGFCIRDLYLRKLNNQWGEVYVPKVGWVRFRLTRMWPEIELSKSARVTLDRSNKWHISFTLRPSEFEKKQTGAIVGIDMGIAKSVTTSDEKTFELPTLLSPGEVQRKKRLERKLARQERGSHRYEQTRTIKARIIAREVDRRKDWIEKTTTQLVREHDVLVIEDLKVKNMVRKPKPKPDPENQGNYLPNRRKAKAGLNRSISNQSWGTFRRRLEDKANAAAFPTFVIPVPPAYTSQRCSECGHTEKKNRKNQASFSCVSCSFTANADVNAARNILAAGLAVAGRGGQPELVGPVKRQPSVFVD